MNESGMEESPPEIVDQGPPKLEGEDRREGAPTGPGGFLERASETSGLWTLAAALIITATSLYLLDRLQPVLRPLLVAILLCYLFLPLYNRIRRRINAVLAFLTIAIGFSLGLQLAARMVYNDVVRINQNLPRYQEREGELEKRFRQLSKWSAPWLKTPAAGNAEIADGDSLASEMSRRVVRAAASAFASIFFESIIIAFYMIFLLQSAAKLPERITASFPSRRADDIMEVVRAINNSISEYLVVKVKASLLVAIPIGLTCWAFGVTGATTWGVLTFFGNFLPYIGPLVAAVPPIVLALLEFQTPWLPVVFITLVLAIHGVTANLIEPAMTGKALDLNPLVVLVGLAFWSLMWGFVGMVLAVPLTVILKIVLEHTPATRPFARLMADSD